MVWAYFDETVVHRQVKDEEGKLIRFEPYQLLFGGCISSQEKWAAFEPKWRAALDAEGVKVFHATDFYSFKKEFEWYTPDGLGTWGDGRITILGTEGYIEMRKYIDIAGRPGGEHLFLVDGKGTQHIDCSAVPLPYGSAFLSDVAERGETAMSQAHCFLACELALKAEAMATRLGHLAQN